MLAKQSNFRTAELAGTRRQRGVVLLVALVVLVAMTLAGIALVRSVYTTNLIAANMGYRQAATNYGDVGIETAVNWLESQSSGSTLYQNVSTEGYTAVQSDPDPVTHQSWDSYWSGLVSANQVKQLKDASGAPIKDIAGNSISYAIHRLCNGLGAPGSTSGATTVSCAQSPATSVASSGNGKGAGVLSLSYSGQIYYRITVQVNGPHNTTSYVQAVVAM
jgi:type IV pilus assembly protein PilX